MVNVAVGINRYPVEHNTFFSKNGMDLALRNNLPLILLPAAISQTFAIYNVHSYS